MAARPHRPRAALVLGGCLVAGNLLAALAGCTAGSSGHPADTSRRATTTQRAATGHQVQFGAFVAPQVGQSPAAAVSALENGLGRTLALDRDYLDWDDPLPNGLLSADRAAGRTTVLSIKPMTRAGRRVPWAVIASGAQDAEIERQAGELRAFGGRVILIFHHEADEAVGYGTAAQFVAAFRHYVTVVRAVGDPDVSFGLVLTPITYGRDIAAWYPGSRYVDWLGTDVFNFGGCKPGVSGWRSLASAGQPFYAWASKQDKPLLLAEFGVPDDPRDPARRAAWLAAAARTIAGWPALRAVLYFDAVGTCDWRLPPASAAFAALRDFARSPEANADPTARLTAAAPRGTTQVPVRFDAGGSTGSGFPTGEGVTAYVFEPGDGSPARRGTGEPGLLIHSYRKPGAYVSTLRITDATGRSASTNITVQVGP